jgi:hypothetical protein
VGHVTHLREYSFSPPGDPLYNLCESNEALEVSQTTHLVGQVGHVTHLSVLLNQQNITAGHLTHL